MSYCGSDADMEASAPLINAVVNNALFHSNSRINQILPQIIHILRFFLLDSLPHILIQINVLRSRLFSGQKSGSSYKSFTFLHYCTFGLGAANDAQNVRADTAREKDNDQCSVIAAYI